MTPFRAAWLATAAVLVSAQQPIPETTARPRPSREGEAATPARGFRVTSRMVLIPVGVRDRKGRVVEDLTAADFELFDNGTRQTLVQAALERGPRDTVIVFDQSESMRHEVDAVHAAVRTFVQEAALGDKVSVIAVRDSADVDVAPTRDTDQLLRELGPGVVAEGRTALFDGVYLGLDRLMKARPPQAAVVILSDGGDNSSRYHESDLRRLAMEAGAAVHGIVTSPPGFPMTPESQGQTAMKRLAEETGGWYWAAKRRGDIGALLRRLESDPRYVLAYVPTGAPADGRHHRVQVKVRRGGGIRLTWRRSYVLD